MVINTILCEDCVSGLLKIDSESILLILSDIPYNLHNNFSLICPLMVLNLAHLEVNTTLTRLNSN